MNNKPIPGKNCRKLQQEVDREISAPSAGEAHRPSSPPAQRRPEAEETTEGDERSQTQEVSGVNMK